MLVGADRVYLCTRMDVSETVVSYLTFGFFFFQAEDGIRDLVRSRGLGDVYKRQTMAYIGTINL